MQAPTAVSQRRVGNSALKAATEISTAAELQQIGAGQEALNGNYKLVNDITVENWTPIGHARAYFNGVFDGGGHTVTIKSLNTKIASVLRPKVLGGDTLGTRQPVCFIGFMGAIGSQGIVKNLRVDGFLEYDCGTNCYVAGGIAGENTGLVQNCTSTAIFSVKGVLLNNKKPEGVAEGLVGFNTAIIESGKSEDTATAAAAVPSSAQPLQAAAEAETKQKTSDTATVPAPESANPVRRKPPVRLQAEMETKDSVATATATPASTTVSTTETVTPPKPETKTASSSASVAETAVVKPTYRRKSPGLACGLSCIYPGIGQFYNGQPVKGALFTGIATLSAVVLAVASDETEQNPELYTEDDDIYAAIGVATLSYFAVWVWSIIDAPISAKKINRRNAELYGTAGINATLSLQPDLYLADNMLTNKRQTVYGLKLHIDF
jgi:hypothetical protein